ncbi:hypothetical protein V3C99_002612 [Haemonchus contortus]|uniref:Uncharacterized protein n=1 Tax=Haemonchus contortus TaxID=6289 RepID=A0A7I5E8K8_HAECO
MDNLDGLAKDGLSYRSDTFSMSIAIGIYTYGSILWLFLLVMLVISNFKAHSLKRRSKSKDYELLQSQSEGIKSPGKMSYKDSKSFRSDRDEWDTITKGGSDKSKKTQDPSLKTSIDTSQKVKTTEASTGAIKSDFSTRSIDQSAKSQKQSHDQSKTFEETK